jgi:hypothetical protein
LADHLLASADPAGHEIHVIKTNVVCVVARIAADGAEEILGLLRRSVIDA